MTPEEKRLLRTMVSTSSGSSRAVPTAHVERLEATLTTVLDLVGRCLADLRSASPQERPRTESVERGSLQMDPLVPPPPRVRTGVSSIASVADRLKGS